MRKLKLNNLKQYVQAISGLFVSAKNPSGVTPKEMEVFCYILEEALKQNKKRVDKDLKKLAATRFDCSLQIITNYVNKFKKKRLVNENGVFNALFLVDTGISIIYEQSQSM